MNRTSSYATGCLLVVFALGLLSASMVPWTFKITFIAILAGGYFLARRQQAGTTGADMGWRPQPNAAPPILGFGRRDAAAAPATASLRAASFVKRDSTASPAGSLEGLEPELRRLDLYQRGLGAMAVAYVATGEDEGVPSRVASIVKAVPRYQAPYYAMGEERAQVVDAANLALMRTAGISISPVLARFVELRLIVEPISATYGQPPLTHTQQLARSAFAAVNAAMYKISTSNNYSKPWSEARSVSEMAQLVQLCGGTMTDLFDNVLRHSDAAFITKGSWHEVPEFAELVRSHPADFVGALPGLDAKQRGAALKLVEHHGLVTLPEIEAALVAMLTKPYGKDERDGAISMLARLDAATLTQLVAGELARVDIDARHGLVQAAGRNGAPELLDLLRKHLKGERAGKVKGAIEALLEASSHAAEDASGTEAAGRFAAVTGETIVLPDLPTEVLVSPGPESRPHLDAIVAHISEQRTAALAKGGTRQPWQVERLQPIGPDRSDKLWAWLQGEPPAEDAFRMHFADDFRRTEGASQLLGVLEAAPLSLSLRAAVWMATVSSVANVVSADYYTRGCVARQFLRKQIERGLDVRVIAALASRPPSSGFDPASMPALDSGGLRQILKSALNSYADRQWRNPLEQFPSEPIWPWLAEHMTVFDEAFGLAPMTDPLSVSKAMTLLAMLPAVPQRYYARITEIAVTEKRPLRRQAIALLKRTRDLDKRVEALLDDARQPVRINAAGWLADMRASSAEAALRKRLKKEKSEPVRTALIEALQRLDADLSDVISPASLTAQAKEALAKGALQLPDWLPVETMPPATFRDGSRVPADLLRYWLSLAIRLKDPSATGQFGTYLDQLRSEDAQAISGWVLDHWIAYDTYSPSLDEANAYASEHAEATWQAERRWRPDQTLDEVFERMKRQRLAEMPNSGSDTKGMLALACRADPAWAAHRVRWFLKNHGRRSNQAMALLDMLAGMGSPVALQVVIAASVRLKQKSTQAHAAEISERYAEDRGWTIDELADRTVPTAGFDDDGVLALPCGEDGKPYEGRLDALLDMHLFNPDGAEVKALPAGDDEATRESKKALSAAKKELKQVVDMQSARLFEAMCVERSWPVSDWRSAFHEHPVMRRLIERLVWQGLGSDGEPMQLFRPTQEGDFTDASDASVDLSSFDRLRLAHGALVDSATSEAWITHLRDYEVKPLFAQFGTTRAPLSLKEGERTIIEDRKGWSAQSLTYRGVAEKLGYERVMGDSAGCNEYAKPFSSLGITAVIHHSGSYAVDENNPVALKGLSFRKEGTYADVKLKDVPPVMLAECWADFHAVADKGLFDPNWENKSPW